MDTYRRKGDLAYEGVGDIQECGHASDVCCSGHRKPCHQWLRTRDISERMVLDPSKDDGQKHCDAHGDSTEGTEDAHLAEGARKTDEEADYGRDHTPNNGASGIAVGERVQKLSSNKTVKTCGTTRVIGRVNGERLRDLP